MNRVSACLITATALLFAAAPGCKAKPSEEACRDAIRNQRVIAGLSTSDVGADPIAAIRSCQGGSSKETVECMRGAKSLEDLQECEGDVGKKYFEDEEKAREDRMKKSSEEAEAEVKPEAEVEAKPDPKAEDDVKVVPVP